MALLIGIGAGYLLGINGIGQKVQSPVQFPQQQNFGPGPQQGQGPQEGGNIQPPQNQGGTQQQPGGQPIQQPVAR